MKHNHKTSHNAKDGKSHITHTCFIHHLSLSGRVHFPCHTRGAGGSCRSSSRCHPPVAPPYAPPTRHALERNGTWATHHTLLHPRVRFDRGRRDSLLSLRASSCSSRRCSGHEATTSPTRHRSASTRMASHEYRSVEARPPRPAAPAGGASASEREHVGARGDDVAVQLLEELLARRVPGLG